MSKGPSSIWRVEEGRLHLALHPGQGRAWNSKARFRFILAGTQSGKTSFMPWLLDRQIQQTAVIEGGSNDYIAITSSYDLFKLKFLPEIRNTFEHVRGTGRYWSGDRIMELSDPRTGLFWARKADDPMWGRIILRAASSGGGLESASARGCVADECGQDLFGLETFEALLRRLSLYMGCIDAGTTLYNLGWLKTHVWDRFQRIGTPQEQQGDRDFDVINFDSTENPAFPVEEFLRALRSMPEWRFNMFYRGLFTRPAGQIYDCFVDADVAAGGHKMRPRALPAGWVRVAGIDFGVVHTAVDLVALEEDAEGYPTGRLILHRTYAAGSRNATEHVERLREVEPGLTLVTGGAASEDAWRQAYLWAGLTVYRPTVADVEVGIDRVYGAIAETRLVVFDTETEFVRQIKDYSRELDERGDPTVKIKDKAKYHLLDALRYLLLLMCPIQSFLPFAPREHLLVRERGTMALDGGWRRFGGLRYRYGEPAAFVLCAMSDQRNVYVEREIVEAGLDGPALAARIATLIAGPAMPGPRPSDRSPVEWAGEWAARRKRRLQAVRIGCNAEMFAPPSGYGEVHGEAVVESFRRAGLVCVRAAEDGRNEWAILRERMSRPFGLRVQRPQAPMVALTLGLVVGSEADVDVPDARGPIAPAQAVAYALMLRPTPVTATEQPKAPEGHLPLALRSERREERGYE